MTPKRYSVFIDSSSNIDEVVLYLEISEPSNEVLHVNRLLDYIIVVSPNERSLWVKGVQDVQDDESVSNS